MHVDRVAADGGHVEGELPDRLGSLSWEGITRFTGARIQRDFYFVPVGQHKVIPTRVLPGARIRTFQRRGFDVLLHEAPDRSDSCLVWVGPYHEATTWFGGPAPRTDTLSHLIASLRFTDSPSGATMTATSRTLVRQYGTTIIASSDEGIVMIRSATSDGGAGRLPAWRGDARGDREVWRSALDLDEEHRDRLAGTPYEWRYIVGSSTAVADVIFTTEDPSTAADGSAISAALDDVRVSWS